jgi:hypothetical protein
LLLHAKKKKKKENKRTVGQSKLMGSFAFISFFSGHSRDKATYHSFLEEESRDKARTDRIFKKHESRK